MTRFDLRLRTLLITPAASSLAQLAERVSAALTGGIGAVQLRDKRLATPELLRRGCELRRITREHGALFFVNGRIDVAVACGADGVHLGRRELPPAAARRLLGADAWVGFSAHDGDAPEDFAGADYVTFSPVFATPEKGATVGLEGLARAAAKYGLPVLALGGIEADALPGVAQSGAAGAAVIRAVYASVDVRAAAERFVHMAQEAWHGAKSGG